MYEAYWPDIDVKDGLKRVMNNKQLYFSLLGRFKAREMTEDLINKINERDTKAIASSAHAIKGTAVNLGMKRLYEAAKKIETRAKTGGECTDLVNPLREALDSTERTLNALVNESK